LHGVIETIGQRKYDLVIDIGSAEGYYAVGLARMLQTKVIAYDPEPIERALCEESARLNCVSSFLECRELFRSSDLERFRNQRVLCVCDCEGFETTIFSSNTIQKISKWDLLIELHGDAVQKLQNLSWPHTTRTIHSEMRSQTYQELEGLGNQDSLVSEHRGSQQTWLWCDSIARQEYA